MRTLLHVAVICLAAMLAFTAVATAQETTARPSPEAARPSPEAIYRAAVNSPHVRGPAEAKAAGEQFCWHARTSLGHFVRGYKAFNDTAWLDWGVKYYDFLIDAMQTGPDGYKGWIGPYIYKGEVWTDVHVGDSILIEGILEFAELVLKDEKLKEKYGQKAQHYVDIAKRDVMEKWDARGTWYEDGEIGGYVGWHTFCQPGKLDTWAVDKDYRGATGALPFNKHMDMGLVSLSLYRITGEEAYRERARKIFNFQKARMMVNGDHYTWNYWEPMGQMDLDLEARKDGGSGMRHWVATHPYRNYQAGEISKIVEAYHSGLTFDQRDLELIIATNLKVMWNGDKENPQFVNSNVRLPQVKLSAEEQKAKDEALAANPLSSEGRAGTLWTPLIDFDPTIRQLYERQLANGKNAVAEINRAYYENVTKKRPPSFERHHKDLPVTVYNALPNQAPALTLAAALPYVVEADKETMLISKSVVDGSLEIALMSADGKQKQAVLHTVDVKGGSDGHAGVFILPWNLQVDGKRLPAGDYRIRWTFGDGYAEYPLTVK